MKKKIFLFIVFAFVVGFGFFCMNWGEINSHPKQYMFSSLKKEEVDKKVNFAKSVGVAGHIAVASGLLGMVVLLILSRKKRTKLESPLTVPDSKK